MKYYKIINYQSLKINIIIMKLSPRNKKKSINNITNHQLVLIQILKIKYKNRMINIKNCCIRKITYNKINKILNNKEQEFKAIKK